MESLPEPCVLGLDLGTGGARAVVASPTGEPLASVDVPFEGDAHRSGMLHEQDPEAWWTAAERAVREAAAQAGVPVKALSIDGTSGSFTGVDAAGTPTTKGLMYNDGRAARLAEEAGAVSDLPPFAATSPLMRMLWLARNEGEAFQRTHTFAHQADFIAARLCGRWGTSDYSNALKTGYDLRQGSWPAWMSDESFAGLGAVRSKLPEVVAPGARLGTVAPALATELGLSSDTHVIAGVSDGTAGFIASGAANVGDDSTILGTTLVFKRLAGAFVESPGDDATGSIYCHRLPQNLWIPGAASNTGGEWIRQRFGSQDLSELDRSAQALIPSDVIAYPLVPQGERFPFASAEARGFCVPECDETEARYAAMLQGTAMVERLAYATLDRLTGPAEGDVYATGGGSRSDIWMQLRADVTGRTMKRPMQPDSAFGSAILAAAGLSAEDLRQTSARMVRFDRTFRPDPDRTRAFDAYYARFVAELKARGYLKDSPA